MPAIISFVRNHLIHILRLLAVVSAAACAHANVPAGTAAAAAGEGVEGVWVHQEQPGHGESMTLSVHGYDVRGDGTYRLEGGRDGTTTIMGSWRRGELRLSIVRDTGIR